MKTLGMGQGHASKKWALVLHEILFPLNIALAVVCALLIRIFSYKLDGKEFVPATFLKYLFFRNAAQINSLIHANADSNIGLYMNLVFSLVGLAVLLLAATSLLTRSALYPALLNPVADFSSLFVVPIALLWSITDVHPSKAGAELFLSSALTTTLKTILIVEILCTSILLIINKKWHLSFPAIATLFGLHFGLWSTIMWVVAKEHILSSALIFISLVFLASSIAWFLYLKQDHLNDVDTEPSRNRTVYPLVYGSLALFFLLFLWVPTKGHSVAHPNDIQSTTIRMTRSACFGRCPVYTLTISGNGRVHYSGEYNVAVVGERLATIQPSQFLHLLEDFDRIHFFSLEDRAFEKCSDTPEVTVSISVDGRNKTVTSNTFCVGTKLGPQAGFVALARQIDASVESNKWINTTSHLTGQPKFRIPLNYGNQVVSNNCSDVNIAPQSLGGRLAKQSGHSR